MLEKLARQLLPRDLITGKTFFPPAVQILREERARRGFVSPLWIGCKAMQQLHLTMRCRYDSTVWLPADFLLCDDARVRRNRAARGTRYFHVPLGSSLSSSKSHLNDVERTKEEDDVVPLLNAAFVEETDLFFFLMHCPFSSDPMNSCSVMSHDTCSGGSCDFEHPPQWVHWGGSWEQCMPRSPGFSWLLPSLPCINAQLQLGRSIDCRQRCTDRERIVDASRKLPGVAEDYMVQLISPPSHAGTLRPFISADHVWLDASTVLDHQLSMYEDAFWVPFHWSVCAPLRQSYECGTPHRSFFFDNTRTDLFLGEWYVNVDQLAVSDSLVLLLAHAEEQQRFRKGG